MDDLFSKMGGLRRRLRVSNAAPVPYVGKERNGFSLPFGGAQDGTSVAERAYDAYGSVGTLFAIVRQLSEGVAASEWHLYQRTSTRDKTRRKEILNSALMTVWDEPNKFYTGSLFRETVQQHLDLVGEGIAVLTRIGSIITEMWPVRPDRMQPVKDADEFIIGWVYIGPDGEQVPLPNEDVLRLMYPNPADPFRGMGPVQTVLNDMDASRYSAEWNKNFFINGARPGGIITVDYRMTDDEFRSFLSRWRQQHQGVANAHRVAVLENAKWQDTQFSMQDMQFAELRNLPRELIREAFAFPKPMLGTVDDVNRANSDAAKEIFAENHTNPRLRRWRDMLNSKFVPQFANGKTQVMDFDDPTPVNHEAADRGKLASSNAAKNLVMAGYDPDAVAEAMGLPKMQWVGIPSAQAAPAAAPSDEDAPASMFM